MSTTATILFEEHQQFRQPWIWLLMLGILAMLIFFLVMVLIRANGQEGALTAELGLGVGIALECGVIALLYLLKLTVRLEADALRIRFVPLANRTIPLGDIASCEGRTYSPLLEYGGWGVRYGWKGMAYNVSGNRGVQLTLVDGKRVLIGSQRADELADAIIAAKKTL